MAAPGCKTLMRGPAFAALGLATTLMRPGVVLYGSLDKFLPEPATVIDNAKERDSASNKQSNQAIAVTSWASVTAHFVCHSKEFQG
jgi:hypothetical protein